MNEKQGHGGPGRGKPGITKDEAIAKLFDAWTPITETEEVSLFEANGRTLAEDLFAKYNQPVVRSSAMDGVAVKSAAFENGMPDTANWKLGVDYVRADTGDDFDDAYDTVIQIENVKLLENGGLEIAEGVEVTKGMKVNPCGSNIKEGTQVGTKGWVIKPQDIAALGMGGYGTVKVYKKPRVAFIPTGSELVPIGSELKRGENFDSNSPMVYAQLSEMGAEVLLHPIVKDDKASIATALDEMLPQADIVIVNAGTSKGGEDFSVQYLQERGNMLFHGVAAVPGRPMSITIVDGKPVINMSGPSFAAFYSCKWLMKEVIGRCLNQVKTIAPVMTEVTLTEDFMTPPPMSALSSFDITVGENGELLATPIQMRGPKGKGAAASFRAGAFYMTTPGEGNYQAGDKLKVFIAR